MKPALKSELKEWFGKIEERENIINNIINQSLKTSKLFYELEDNKIEESISKIAVNILIKDGCDFKKRRFNGNQLSVEDGRLCLREYRCHNSHPINFLSGDLLLVFPESFAYGLQQIKDIIKEYNLKKENFKAERDNYGYRSRRYHTYQPKVELINEELKSEFEIVNDCEDEGIEIKDDVKISLSSDIDGNAEIRYGSSQLLYYDKVYNKVLEFIDKLKSMSRKAKEDYDKVTAQLSEMVEEDNFNMLMVANEI